MKKDQYIQQLAQSAIKEFESSKSFYTTVYAEREKALRYYMQLPMGNETAGFSQFITSDVRDTVNFYQANLIEMFMTGAAPVRFNPLNERDVGQADLETKYTQHVLFEENKGFEAFYTWFMDALISKNGVVKCYWDERIDETPENYESLGYMEYMQLLNDESYRIDKVEVESPLFEGKEFTPAEFGQIVAQIGDISLLNSAEFEVYGTRIKECSKPVIENVAPERFFISQNQLTLDLNYTDYCSEQTFLSKNMLLADGYDYQMVMNLPTGNITTDTNDGVTRYAKESGQFANSAPTESGELVEVIIHYIRDAKDKDPKLYCIKTVGNEVIDWEEVDRIPYHVITPKINPYRFYGDSIADEVVDIQWARSNLWRSAFDNVKYSVVPRTTSKGDVDLDQLSDYVPAANINLGMTGEVGFFSPPFVADKALEIGAILENQRAERTGFSKETMGLDPSSLAQSTNFIGSAILNLSTLRLKMVASTFANTGVKSLYLHVRELMIKHEKREKLFEFNGKFVSITPRSWVKERSTTVKTGLGHAGKVEAANSMQAILNMQEKLVGLQGGASGAFVNPGNIYAALKRAAELSGIIDADTYFSNPEGYQPPPPEPTQQDKANEVYFAVEKYKADKKAETDVYKAETDASVKIYETNQKVILENAKMTKDYQAELKASNEATAAALRSRVVEGEKLSIEKSKIDADLTKHRIDAKLKAGEMAITDGDLNPNGSPVIDAISGMADKFTAALGKLDEGQKLTAKEQRELNSELVKALKKGKRVLRDDNGRVVGVE